jgi:hypothetical protein
LEFDGDVEDVFARTFVVDYEEYGTVKTTELKPGGDSIPVTESNREEYVDLYVKWLLVDSIEAQFSAFSEGFHEVKPLILHHPHDKHSTLHHPSWIASDFSTRVFTLHHPSWIASDFSTRVFTLHHPSWIASDFSTRVFTLHHPS